MQHPVVLFDGVCNLCNGAIQFIIKHDRKQVFRFAALQSDYARKKLNLAALDAKEMQSIVLIEGEKVYKRSTAVLRMARKLSGIWPIAYALIIVPVFIRDAVYNYVARKRYQWFGKRESCMLPTAETERLFIKD